MTDQRLCQSPEYSMDVKLLTEFYLEFLSLKVGCTGLSEYTCQNATLLEILCHGSYVLYSFVFLAYYWRFAVGNEILPLNDKKSEVDLV